MTRATIKKILFLPPLILAFLAGACARNFPAENQLQGLRILAIRATPPWIASGGSSTLDALVYSPDPEIQYEWSWCPLRGGSESRYACSMTAEDFQKQLTAAGISGVESNYNLGTSASASFGYFGTTDTLTALCYSKMITCPTEGLSISIGLTVKSGGKTARAFKEIYLMLDSTSTANANPVLGEMRIGAVGTTEENAGTVPAGSATVTLSFGNTYQFFVEVPTESAESYSQAFSQAVTQTVTQTATPTAGGTYSRNVTETLTVSWYIEGGTTTVTQTSFNSAVTTTSLDTLGQNQWTLPSAGEFDHSEIKIIPVIRDNRGGVGWLERTFLLKSE